MAVSRNLGGAAARHSQTRKPKSAISTADAGNRHATSSPSKPLPRASATAAAKNAARDAGSAAMEANAGSVWDWEPVPASAPTERRVRSARFLDLSAGEKAARRPAWPGSAGSAGLRVVGCTARAE